MPQDRPGAFNQALMELGATVCVPNGQARCEECPLKNLCQGHRDGIELEFPKKAAKKPRRVEERTVLVLLEGTTGPSGNGRPKAFCRDFMSFESLRHILAEEVLEYLKEEGFSPLHIRELPGQKHIFSHVEWPQMTAIRSIWKTKKPKRSPSFLWNRTRLEQEYPIPSPPCGLCGLLRKK